MFVKLAPGSMKHKEVLTTWIFMLIVLFTEVEMFHTFSHFTNSSDIRPTCCFSTFQEFLLRESDLLPCWFLLYSIRNVIILQEVCVVMSYPNVRLCQEEERMKRRRKEKEHSSFMCFPAFDGFSQSISFVFGLQGKIILNFTSVIHCFR